MTKKFKIRQNTFDLSVLGLNKYRNALYKYPVPQYNTKLTKNSGFKAYKETEPTVMYSFDAVQHMNEAFCYFHNMLKSSSPEMILEIKKILENY